MTHDELVEAMARAISEATLDWGDEQPEVWETHRITARATLAAIREAAKWDAADFRAILARQGLAVVPVEPTKAMHKAACAEIEKAAVLNYGSPASYKAIWAAMLAAAGGTDAG